MNWKLKVFIGLLVLATATYTILVFRGGGGDRRRRGGIVILCAGGSITAAGYPEYLQREFDKSGKRVTVLNGGVTAHDSGKYLSHVKAVSLLEETDPDIVLFLPGTDDVWIRGEKANMDAFLANISEVITLVESYVNSKARKPVLLLGNIPPVRAAGLPLHADSARRVVEVINPAIAEMARKHSITLVDNCKFLIEHFHVLSSIHPDEEGSKLLAESWLEVVVPFVDVALGLKESELTALRGQIVFQSNRDGQWEIYVMDADGSDLKRLTENEWDDEYPVWSPDGREIVFKSNRDGNWEIYKMDADGSDQVRLTDCDAEDADPCWSPDGEKIIFHSSRDRNWDIYIMDADGKNLVRLTDSLHKEIIPSWSPDGKKVAFASNKIFGWQLYVMNVDGDETKRLTRKRDATYSDWSPDGSKLAYVLKQPERKSDIWTINADGTGKNNLTDEVTGYSFSPGWSPDGKRIAFARKQDGEISNWDIWIMNADGSRPVQITDHPGQDKFPDWF